jgi:predicted TIM-barrel fold metal-dependent hydrolase
MIALEGEPHFDGTLPNAEIEALADPARMRIAVPYAGAGSSIDGALIKYHPRREGYEPGWVDADISRFDRKLVLIDSLNAISWAPRDFFGLALAHPQAQFVMCHAGGYDLLEFVKMCRFASNVWLDFSVTQHEFGWVSGQRSPAFVADLIDHALGEWRTAPRIIFGSDYPLLEQADAVTRLVDLVADPEPFLTGNFERLLELLELP